MKRLPVALSILLVGLVACSADDGTRRSTSTWLSTTSSGQGGSTRSSMGTGGNTISDKQPLIALTFSGECTPVFGGKMSVASNDDSISVYATNQTPSDNLDDSSLQLSLRAMTGKQILSTQHRIDSGIVVNLVDDSTTWTNIGSSIPDPISGQMDIVANQQSAGIVQLTFANARLARAGNNASLCVINGVVETFGEVGAP